MKKIKKRYFFLLIILVSTLVFGYMNRRLFEPENFRYAVRDFKSSIKGEKVKSLSFRSFSKENVAFFDNDLAILTDSSFTVLTQRFRKKFEIKHNFKSPVLKCSKYKSLIFDSEGYNYIVTNRFESINEGKVKNKIITGEISEKDNIIFITESDEYFCEMAVINVSGEYKFRYFFANTYVIDVSINDIGDKIAICGMKSENGVIKSIVQIFDIKSETPVFSKEFEDKFMSINFFDDRDCMLIGNKSIICVKNVGEEILEIKHNKQTCLFSFDKSFGLAVSISPSNDYRNQTIMIINKSCQKISEINTRKNLKSIYFKNKIVTTMSENQATAVKLNGKIISKSKVPSNCKASIFLPKPSRFAVFGSEVLSFL